MLSAFVEHYGVKTIPSDHRKTYRVRLTDRLELRIIANTYTIIDDGRMNLIFTQSEDEIVFWLLANDFI